MLVTLLTWIVFGLIVGVLARALYPGSNSMGILATVGLGLIGSFVGGFVANLLTGLPAGQLPTHLHAAGLIGSVLGALLVIFVGRVIHSRRSYA